LEKDEKAGFKPSSHHKYRVFRFVVIIPYGHSHASLLIELGFSPLLIAERLGHENIETTLNTYSHLYPHKQAELAQKLENVGF
jgi:integrase